MVSVTQMKIQKSRKKKVQMALRRLDWTSTPELDCRLARNYLKLEIKNNHNEIEICHIPATIVNILLKKPRVGISNLEMSDIWGCSSYTTITQTSIPTTTTPTWTIPTPNEPTLTPTTLPYPPWFRPPMAPMQPLLLTPTRWKIFGWIFGSSLVWSWWGFWQYHPPLPPSHPAFGHVPDPVNVVNVFLSLTGSGVFGMHCLLPDKII